MGHEDRRARQSWHISRGVTGFLSKARRQHYDVVPAFHSYNQWCCSPWHYSIDCFHLQFLCWACKQRRSSDSQKDGHSQLVKLIPRPRGWYCCWQSWRAHLSIYSWLVVGRSRCEGPGNYVGGARKSGWDLLDLRFCSKSAPWNLWGKSAWRCRSCDHGPTSRLHLQAEEVLQRDPTIEFEWSEH